MATPEAAVADDGDAPSLATAPEEHHVEPPPPPAALGRELLLDIHGAAVVPLYVIGLCPNGHECVMNAGVAIGVTVEQRWPDRVGLLLSYDAWVVDSDSLFEIGLMHSFRAGVRYVLDDSLNVHRTNEVIKVLTVISVITLPLTLVTGIFGMNIGLPLQLQPDGGLYAFGAVLLLMVGIALGMLAIFRWRGWL